MLTKEQHAPPAVLRVAAAPRVAVLKTLPFVAETRGPDRVILLGSNNEDERRTLTTFAPTKLEASNDRSGEGDVLVKDDPSNTVRRFRAFSVGFPAAKAVLCAEINGPESVRLAPFSNRIVPFPVATVLESRKKNGDGAVLVI